MRLVLNSYHQEKPLGTYTGTIVVTGDTGNSPQLVDVTSYTAADGARFETHACRNVNTGQLVELKTKFQ